MAPTRVPTLSSRNAAVATKVGLGVLGSASFTKKLPPCQVLYRAPIPHRRGSGKC
jgi:hypothetical protein